MDGFEVLVYIIITIIWIIVQNSRKKKLKQQKEARKAFEEGLDPDASQRERQPDRSVIDEILEELRQERGEEVEEYRPEPTRNAPEPVITGQSTLEKKTVEYDDMLADLEKQKRQKDQSRFDAYKTKEDKWAMDEEDEEENEYASLIFEDPDSPKKAIILSEILNRRHF